MTDFPHVPAAFINAIREEGTKAEACDWLQKTWNELCAVKRGVTSKEREWMLHYELSLNRRAAIEQELFNVANGKRGTLSPDECRALALKLGMSGPDTAQEGKTNA